MDSVFVKNFRSIEKSGDIKINRLNLFIGANSSGKSSILRLFPMFKQSVDEKLDAPLLWNGSLVDFGSFKDFVRNHDSSNSLEIGFKLLKNNPYQYDERFSSFLRDSNFGIKVKGSDCELSCTLQLTEDEDLTRLQSLKLEYEGEKIEIHLTHAKVEKIIINEIPAKLHNDIFFLQRDSILPAFFEEKNDKGRRNFFEIARDQYYYQAEIVNFIKEHAGKRLSDDRLYRNVRALLGICTKDDLIEKLRGLNKDIITWDKFTSKMRSEPVLLKQLHVIVTYSSLFKYIDLLNSYLATSFRKIFWIAPLRAKVDRYYRSQEFSVAEIDSHGSNLPYYLKRLPFYKLDEFKTWVKKHFDIDVNVNSTGSHYSLVVKNSSSEIYNNVSDVGFGISQILPIIVMLWQVGDDRDYDSSTHSKLIVLEQPELHLHPALQAKFIDFVVKYLKDYNNIKLIIETHSETIVNRLGQHIRKSNISCGDISNYMFSIVHEKTNISTSSFNSDGVLDENWPFGFFEPEIL